METDERGHTVAVHADEVLASDAERERTVEELRRHAAEGRLDVAGLEHRTATALAASTRGDLAELTRDLPRRVADLQHSEGRPSPVRTFLLVQALLVTIWALTGMGYFWPLWPILGWGLFAVPGAGCALRHPGGFGPRSWR